MVVSSVVSAAQGDIWACAEHINGNIVKYNESMKPREPQGLSEDFMDQPVKRVYCVKCIRADCKPIAFITCSLAESANPSPLKQSDTDMFRLRYIQNAVIHKTASGLVFVTSHRLSQAGNIGNLVIITPHLRSFVLQPYVKMLVSNMSMKIKLKTGKVAHSPV